jgi:hypothetical protein
VNTIRDAGLLGWVVDSCDDAIVSKDLNGIIASWHTSAERIFGYTAIEVIGKPISILAVPDRANEMSEILNKIKSTYFDSPDTHWFKRRMSTTSTSEQDAATGRFTNSYVSSALDNFGLPAGRFSWLMSRMTRHGFSCRKHIVRYVFGNNAAGSDHRTGANAHTGKNERPATDPNIRADGDWFAELLLTTELSVRGVHGRQNLGTRTKESKISNLDRADIEHDTVEIEKDAFTEFDIATVVTEEGRLHPYGITALPQKL